MGANIHKKYSFGLNSKLTFVQNFHFSKEKWKYLSEMPSEYQTYQETENNSILPWLENRK